MKKHVLIIEDDPDIVRLLEHYLSSEKYTVSSAKDGVEGLELARREIPRVVILDLMLPGIDGLEVCRQLRQDARTSNIAILMLTAKAEETDKVVGLELGADDYMSKPFSPRELVARIKALLRRSEFKAATEKVYKYGGLTLDEATFEVHNAGQPVELTSKEFGLLQTFLRNVGKMYSRDSLLSEVWGDDYSGGPRTVDVHIRKLREKIPSLSEDIITVKNHGYKLRVK